MFLKIKTQGNYLQYIAVTLKKFCNTIEVLAMHSLEISILKAVTYFDVFSYPLTQDEIIFFLDQPASQKEISRALDRLINAKQLSQFNNFYCIKNDTNLAKRRIQGNRIAEKHLKKARRVAGFLYWIPYIRGIAVSGSLSKNFADENSDLDFFVITAANRLWIVRILYSFLYKIVSVLRIKKWFCLNYFIDELDLEIKERNIFTAVEISTLMPLTGKTVFGDFFNANKWVYNYQPNYLPNYTYLKKETAIIPKRFAEWTMNFERGDKLDDKLQAFFRRRFERMIAENKLSEKGITIGAYKAEKHTCKPLPQYFQPKILTKFQERFKQIEDRYHSFLINKEKVVA